MKKEYDFSNAERGKFYQPNRELHLPVYLDAEVLAFVEELARKRQTDISEVVNRLLRGNMELAEVMK
jgi:hypothetical protein